MHPFTQHRGLFTAMGIKSATNGLYFTLTVYILYVIQSSSLLPVTNLVLAVMAGALGKLFWFTFSFILPGLFLLWHYQT
jgi:hypothetical protein